MISRYQYGINCDAYYSAQAEKKKEIARLLQMRRYAMPKHIGDVVNRFWLGRHMGCLANRRGHLVWVETWCNNPSVIAHIRDQAKKLAQCECDVLFLPTEMSIRAIGDRQPMLIRPPRSNVDLRKVAACLREAGFVGVHAPLTE